MPIRSKSNRVRDNLYKESNIRHILRELAPSSGYRLDALRCASISVVLRKSSSGGLDHLWLCDPVLRVGTGVVYRRHRVLAKFGNRNSRRKSLTTTCFDVGTVEFLVSRPLLQCLFPSVPCYVGSLYELGVLNIC